MPDPMMPPPTTPTLNVMFPPGSAGGSACRMSRSGVRGDPGAASCFPGEAGGPDTFRWVGSGLGRPPATPMLGIAALTRTAVRDGWRLHDQRDDDPHRPSGLPDVRLQVPAHLQ